MNPLWTSQNDQEDDRHAEIEREIKNAVGYLGEGQGVELLEPVSSCLALDTGCPFLGFGLHRGMTPHTCLLCPALCWVFVSC